MHYDNGEPMNPTIEQAFLELAWARALAQKRAALTIDNRRLLQELLCEAPQLGITEEAGKAEGV